MCLAGLGFLCELGEFGLSSYWDGALQVPPGQSAYSCLAMAPGRLPKSNECRQADSSWVLSLTVRPERYRLGPCIKMRSS